MKLLTEPCGLDMFERIFFIRDENRLLLCVANYTFLPESIEQIGPAFGMSHFSLPEFIYLLSYKKHRLLRTYILLPKERLTAVLDDNS